MRLVGVSSVVGTVGSTILAALNLVSVEWLALILGGVALAIVIPTAFVVLRMRRDFANATDDQLAAVGTLERKAVEVDAHLRRGG